MSSDKPSETLLIGLSGPSSSGKTTLARLLREIFNIDASPETTGLSIKLFILHEDDFYKTDTEIPSRTITSTTHGTRTIQDWDCVDSLNLTLLDRTVRHVKAHGRPPPDLFSQEDQNSVGDVGVSNDEVTALRDDVAKRLSSQLPRDSGSNECRSVSVCILDGFLLFPPPPAWLDRHDPNRGDEEGLRVLRATMVDALDLKLFLPSTRERTVDRRARRAGYVTLEGFWADPPGFVEDVVWPNYVRDHRWMFRDEGDVDGGKVDREGEWVGSEGIVVGPGSGDVSMREVLGWAVDVVMHRIVGT